MEKGGNRKERENLIYKSKRSIEKRENKYQKYRKRIRDLKKLYPRSTGALKRRCLTSV